MFSAEVLARVPQSFAVGETPPNKSPPHSAAGSLRTGDARASTEPPPLPADAGKSRQSRVGRFPCLLPPRTFLRIVDLAGVVCPAQFATQRVAIWEGLLDVPHIAEIGRIEPFAKLRRGPPRNRCAAVAPRVTVTSERQSKSMPSNVAAKLRVPVDLGSSPVILQVGRWMSPLCYPGLWVGNGQANRPSKRSSMRRSI